MSRRGCTRRLFFCQKNGKEDLCYGTQNHAKATDKNHIHLQISQQILLGKFAEPKRRYLAQNCYFDVKVEPFWLNNEACPNGKRSVFGIVQRRNSLKLRYLRFACYYALRGVSHGITSRDFVCQSPNQNPPQEADLLFEGLPPPIPRKGEMILWGKIYESPCVSRQKKKRKYSQKPESAG